MAPTDGTRKRKPPTFRHLPINRAKKLKQSWVEIQKLKSHWKAQKRKEGIVTKSRQMEELVVEEDDEDSHSGPAGSDEDPPQKRRSSALSQEGEHPSGDGDKGSVEDSPESSGSLSEQGRSDKDSREKQSLRGLQRQAHSHSSLHTHNANSLRTGPHTRGGGRGRGRGAGYSQGGRGGYNTGRGQPDMRLRMNAMLERIKRDFI